MSAPANTWATRQQELDRRVSGILQKLPFAAITPSQCTADITLFAQHAVNAAHASSDAALGEQQQLLGDCLKQSLPLSMANAQPALECMFLRRPFGQQHLNLRRDLEALPQYRSQNRPVIAIAQTSGAGKTKLALSAAMCDHHSIDQQVAPGTASAGALRPYYAVYALMANSQKSSEAVEAFQQCTTSLMSIYDSYCVEQQLLSPDHLKVAKYFDQLHIRLFMLLLHTFVLRAALLLAEVKKLSQSTDPYELAEMLVRAQFLSQHYAVKGKQLPDVMRALFEQRAAQVLTDASWTACEQEVRDHQRAQLPEGEFYVVCDEVCTLLQKCVGYALHFSDLSSSMTADKILEKQRDERSVSPKSNQETRTSMFYLLRRVLYHCPMPYVTQFVLLDTHFRIWRPLLDANSSNSVRLAIK